MPANGKTVRVARTGPPPEMEIIIGHAQAGSYTVKRKAAEQPWLLVRSGNNVDNVGDRFPLADTTAELDGNEVRWAVRIAAHGTQGQIYSLQVVLTQSGQTLDRFEETGPLDGVKTIVDAVTIALV